MHTNSTNFIGATISWSYALALSDTIPIFSTSSILLPLMLGYTTMYCVQKECK